MDSGIGVVRTGVLRKGKGRRKGIRDYIGRDDMDGWCREDEDSREGCEIDNGVVEDKSKVEVVTLCSNNGWGIEECTRQSHYARGRTKTTQASFS